MSSSTFNIIIGFGHWGAFLLLRKPWVDYSPGMVSPQVRGEDVTFVVSIVRSILRLCWFKWLMTLLLIFMAFDGDWYKSR